MLGGEGRNQRISDKGGVERWKHTFCSAPLGFSVEIGPGWGDQMSENKLQPLQGFRWE